MNIQRGLVKDLGYEDTECTFVTGNDNVQYYFANGTTLADGLYVVTPNVKEAVGHEDYSTLGVMSEDGNLIIPCDNKRIELLTDRFLLVEKTFVEGTDVQASIVVKDDPMQANKYNNDSLNIKHAMENQMGPDGVFVFDDMFSEANLYDFRGKKVLGDESTGFSFIGQVGNDLYLHSININDSIKVIKGAVEETGVTEPIAPAADMIAPTAPETVVPDATLQPEVTPEVPMAPAISMVEPMIPTPEPVAPEVALAPNQDEFTASVDMAMPVSDATSVPSDVVPTAVPASMVEDAIAPTPVPSIPEPDGLALAVAVEEEKEESSETESIPLSSLNTHPEDKYLDSEDSEETKSESNDTNDLELDSSRYDKYIKNDHDKSEFKNAIYDEAVGVIKNLVDKNRRLENDVESKGVRIKELELDNKDFAKTIKTQRERIEKLEQEKEKHLIEIRKHKKSIETLETEKREFLRTIEAQSRKLEDQESKLRSQDEELSKHESGKEQLVKLLEDVTEVLD